MTFSDPLAELVSQTGRTQGELCLAALAFLGGQATGPQIKAALKSHGLKRANAINVHTAFKNSSGMVLNNKAEWKLLSPGEKRLNSLGFQLKTLRARQLDASLRTELDRLSDGDRKTFIAEAIAAFEHQLFRAAVVLSWIGAVNILHDFVATTHLKAFNAAFRSRYPKSNQKISNAAALVRIKESDFLQVCEDCGIIDKSIKTELLARLDLRNQAGHPNKLKVGENMAAAHVESLLKNVFLVF